MLGRRVQLAPPGTGHPTAPPRGKDEGKRLGHALPVSTPPPLVRQPWLRAATSPQRAALPAQPVAEGPEQSTKSPGLFSVCTHGCQRPPAHIGACWTVEGMQPPSIKKKHALCKVKQAGRLSEAWSPPTPPLKRARDDDSDSQGYESDD